MCSLYGKGWEEEASREGEKVAGEPNGREGEEKEGQGEEKEGEEEEAIACPRR